MPAHAVRTGLGFHPYIIDSEIEALIKSSTPRRQRGLSIPCRKDHHQFADDAGNGLGGARVRFWNIAAKRRTDSPTAIMDGLSPSQSSRASQIATKWSCVAISGAVQSIIVKGASDQNRLVPWHGTANRSAPISQKIGWIGA